MNVLRDSSSFTSNLTHCLLIVNRGCCQHNTALAHLDQPNTYVRVLFVDLSSPFNKVIPHKLIYKLCNLGLGSSLCTQILDTGLPQQQTTKHQDGRMNIIHSHPEHWHTTGLCPQPPPLLPLHPWLLPHPHHQHHSQVCWWHILGLITKNSESAYREEIQHLTEWCSENNLV